MKHSESFTGKSSNHWVPSNLHCKVQSEGGLVCQKPDENREEFLSVSNNFCRMELLFILKSEVIVDILLFQYSLIAAVCWIDESKLDAKHHGKWHLVSTIQIPPGYLSSPTVTCFLNFSIFSYPNHIKRKISRFSYQMKTTPAIGTSSMILLLTLLTQMKRFLFFLIGNFLVYFFIQ